MIGSDWSLPSFGFASTCELVDQSKRDAGDYSYPSVNQLLTLLLAFLITSAIAIAANIHAHGARTSMRRIITHEKYDARTPYIAMKSLPNVHF